MTNANVSGFILNSEKNNPNGIPTLDANSKILKNQIPDLGAEPAGAVAQAIAAHEATQNPHKQYALADHTHGDLVAWSNVPGTTARFTRLGNGLILINGLITKALKPANGEVIATLPVGFRPLQTTRVISFDQSSNSRPYLEVSPATGQVTYNNPGTIPNLTTFLSLNHLIFLGS